MCFTAILESIAETCLEGVVIVKGDKHGKHKRTGQALPKAETQAQARSKAGNKGRKD